MFGLGEQYVLGYDLSNEYAQISFIKLGDETPTTMSLTADAEDYNIPACLFKRQEVNQWFYGKEAVNYSEVEEGQLIENLWEYALVGEKIQVVEDEFDAIALLSLFIKRSLSTLSSKIKNLKIAGIMFTVPNLTKRAIEVLNMAVGALGLKDAKIRYEGRDESIYYYLIHQSKELWQSDVLIYDMDKTGMDRYMFTVNKKTKPFVALVDRCEYRDLTADTLNIDEAFLEVVKQDVADRIVSSAFLLGNGFEKCELNNSLRELCRNRRAFRGNNLYSKGACYAMQYILEDKHNYSQIFLGKDKLKVNVGMEITDVNEDKYFPVLNGGDNWFDSSREFDVILKEGNSFEVVITPLDGRNIRKVEIVLDGLNNRGNKLSRIHLKMYAESENVLRVCATDLGFGEYFASTHQLFTKQIKLS